jgi:predicted membrane-bound spermidine synthase
LYFFDLVGAGLGCLVVSLMFTYSDLPPVITTLLLCSLLLVFNTRFKYKSIAVIICVVVFGIVQAMAFIGVVFKEHPEPATISATLFGRSKSTGVEELASRWNHLTRTALYRNQANTLNTAAATFVIVQDDGISNVTVTRYDPAYTAEDVKKSRMHHAIPQVLGRRFESALVMFAGSGKDMIYLDAASSGKAEITGVEINESVKEMALHPAVFSMNLKHFFMKPNIHYVIKEGRDFLNNDRHKYDVILAATNGAVHANRTGHTRKYLDTYEAMASYLDHLNKDGLIIFINQPIDRKLESFKQLFKERKIGDFTKCVYAFGKRGTKTLHSAVVQLKPFTKNEIDALLAQQNRVARDNETLYNPFGPGRSDIEQFVKVAAEQRGQSLVTDDRPFTRQVELTGFSLMPGKSKLMDLEYSSNWIKIFTCIVFAGISLIVIFIARFGGKKEGRLPLLWLAYFFITGVSYMGVEIGLIGKTELFVGNPLYATAVILAFFLMSNGLGAYLQDRFHVMKGLKSLLVITAVSIVWGVLCVELFNRTMLSLPMVFKVLMVAIAVLPSGTALGMYYPFGVASLVGAGKDAMVPITYGAATLSSVLGSSLAMTLISNIGFSTIIIAGAVGYAFAAFAYIAAKRFEL